MKAGVFDGNQIKLIDIPKPQLTKEDDILIEIKSSGICGSDLRILFGETEPHTLPIGHELSGIVKEVNSSKYEHMIGKKVAVDTVSAGKACDSCKHCLNGFYTYCLDKDLDTGGSYAEYITRRAKGCFTLNEEMTFNEGALIEPLAVAVQAFRKLLPVAGDNLIILGSGTIGLMCLYMASQMNFNQIIITGKYKHQKDMARYLGADHVLDYDDPNLYDFVKDHTNGLGLDLAIETVGAYSSQIQTLTDAVHITKKGGKIGIVGGFRVPVEFDFLVPYMNGQSLIFPICYNLIDGKHDFEIAIDLFNKNKVDLSKLITRVFKFSEIESAFLHTAEEREKVIKVHLNN